MPLLQICKMALQHNSSHGIFQPFVYPVTLIFLLDWVKEILDLLYGVQFGRDLTTQWILWNNHSEMRTPVFPHFGQPLFHSRHIRKLNTSCFSLFLGPALPYEALHPMPRAVRPVTEAMRDQWRQDGSSEGWRWPPKISIWLALCKVLSLNKTVMWFC